MSIKTMFISERTQKERKKVKVISVVEMSATLHTLQCRDILIEISVRDIVYSHREHHTLQCCNVLIEIVCNTHCL